MGLALSARECGGIESFEMSRANDDQRPSVASLLAEWDSRATLALVSCNRAATRYRQWNMLLGIGSAALSAVAGTAVFATLDNGDVGSWLRIIVGAVIVLAATLTAIQTFARFPELVDEYERSARRFGKVRREIEQMRPVLVGADPAADETQEILSALRAKVDAAGEESPNAPRRIWEKTRREMKGDFGWWDRWRRRLAGRTPPERLSSEDLQHWGKQCGDSDDRGE